MKKIIFIIALICFFNGIASNAISINTQSSNNLVINGIVINANNIGQIVYSDRDKATLIYMTIPAGEIRAIPSTYNEFVEIMQAVWTTKNTYSPYAYTTNYQYYYSNNNTSTNNVNNGYRNSPNINYSVQSSNVRTAPQSFYSSPKIPLTCY